jgi:hypothetical protein
MRKRGRSWPSWLRPAGLAACLFPALAQGQSQDGPGSHSRVPATIALVERLPAHDAPFVILRRGAAEGGDVILLAAGADAGTLSDAVRALLLVRRQQGDTSGAHTMLRLSQPARHAPVLPWAARVLADLQRTVRQPISGIGNVPAVEVWLPRQERANRGVR